MYSIFSGHLLSVEHSAFKPMYIDDKGCCFTSAAVEVINSLINHVFYLTICLVIDVYVYIYSIGPGGLLRAQGSWMIQLQHGCVCNQVANFNATLAQVTMSHVSLYMWRSVFACTSGFDKHEKSRRMLSSTVMCTCNNL